MNSWMNGQKCGLMNGWIGVGRKDGWMRGEMDGGTDRRADRWISGNMDKQAGKKKHKTSSLLVVLLWFYFLLYPFPGIINFSTMYSLCNQTIEMYFILKQITMQSTKQHSNYYGLCIHLLQNGIEFQVEQELNNVPLLLATYSPRRKFPTHSQSTRRLPERHPRICGQVQPTKRKCANGIFSLADRASV